MQRGLLYRAAMRSRDDISREITNIKKNHLTGFILSIIYLVGILGILIPFHADFILLTPINLLLGFGFIIWWHPNKDWRLPTLLLICFLVGMIVEILGVHTGHIFGSYEYGPVLGPMYKNVPWMIGINWATLIYCCGVATLKIIPKRPLFIKIILGGLLMFSLDILIEPVAILYDFWQWENNVIPTQNYLAWFLISCVLSAIFHVLYKDLKNNVAFTLLCLQFLFFFILGINW